MGYNYFSVAIHTGDLGQSTSHMWKKSHFAEVRSCMLLALKDSINKLRISVFCRVKQVLRTTWE